MIRRWLFITAVVASVFLCSTAISLWVRSHSVGDAVQWQTLHGPAPNQDLRQYDLNSETGHFLVFISRYQCAEISTRPREIRPLKYFRNPIVKNGDGWMTHYTGRTSPSRLDRIGFCYMSLDEQPLTYFYLDGHQVMIIGYRGLTIPYWFPLLIGSLLPLKLALSITGRRKLEGSCPTCGYNLTANTSGVCPECGTTIALKGKMLT